MRTRPEVHQFIPTLGSRDAVGNHALETARALSEAKLDGHIWAEEIYPELKKRAQRYEGYRKLRSAKRGSNLILYSCSTGSRGMVDYILERPEPKTIRYHNITPPRFFEQYDPGAAANLANGREELQRLATKVKIAVADSDFNAQDLRELGIADVRVIPIYLPPGLDAEPDPSLFSRLARTKKGIDLLFVGRVAPSKGHTQLLRAFAAMRAAIDPHARLFIVGPWGPEPYIAHLMRLREHLNLEEGCVFAGRVSEEQLVAHYHNADVYISMSEHEGFGVPLVEAMRFGVPVMAYDAGAVAETLSGAGVLLKTQDPALVAEIAARISSDESLRKEICKNQEMRMRDLDSVPRDRLVVEAARATLNG